jgi:hypothetical protein
MDAHRLMSVEHNPEGSSRGLDIDVPYLGSVKIDLQATSDFMSIAWRKRVTRGCLTILRRPHPTLTPALL